MKPKTTIKENPRLATHKHKFFLKSKYFGSDYYRECSICGRKAKVTKYKIDLTK